MLLVVGVDACVCLLLFVRVGCCLLVLLFGESFVCACCVWFVVCCLVLFLVCWLLLMLGFCGFFIVDWCLVLADGGLLFDDGFRCSLFVAVVCDCRLLVVVAV